MPSHEPTTVAASLDGRRSVMDSSTTSEVNPAAPSRFQYSERDGVIWGNHDADTVVLDDARASWTDDVPEALERTPA